MSATKRLLVNAAETAFWAFVCGALTAAALMRADYLIAAAVAAFALLITSCGLVVIWADHTIILARIAAEREAQAQEDKA